MLSEERDDLEAKIAQATKRYGEIEGKHARALARLNAYSTEMADLNMNIRRWSHKLTLVRRELTKIRKGYRSNRG